MKAISILRWNDEGIKYSGGRGTQLDPYIIDTLEDLRKLSQWANPNDIAHYRYVGDWDAGVYFKQTSNIDASATSTWNSGKGFRPIGDEDTYFRGLYDGNYKYTDSITISRSNEDYIGFFGVAEDATISNLTIQNHDITGNLAVGALGGYILGNIAHCSAVNGTISGNRAVGGFAGSTTLMGNNDCHSVNCNVTGDYYVGGFSGYIAGTPSDCTSSGIVVGDIIVGGFAGESYGRFANITVSECSSTCTVSANEYVGGFIGNIQYDSDVANCYARGFVSGTSYVGGLIGSTSLGPAAGTSVVNCYSTGSVSGTSYTGGLLGELDAATVNTNNYYDSDTSGQSDTGKGEPRTTVQLKTSTIPDATTYVLWDNAIWDENGTEYPIHF